MCELPSEINLDTNGLGKVLNMEKTLYKDYCELGKKWHKI